MKLIDLHTHRVKDEGDIQILNIFAQELTDAESDFPFSVGLHPWHIGQVNLQKCFEAIEASMRQKNMLAVGECGLDRSIATDFELQKYCFTQQIQIAEKHNKPLIIHCVRAYSDLQNLKKETRSEIPWIIHGYNGNLVTILSLIKQGFYFSVGESLLKNESKLIVFQSIPVERLFLETDAQDISIHKVYQLAMQLLNMDKKMLTEIISNNFNSLFGECPGPFETSSRIITPLV